jgi:hypothetical protein
MENGKASTYDKAEDGLVFITRLREESIRKHERGWDISAPASFLRLVKEKHSSCSFVTSSHRKFTGSSHNSRLVTSSRR